MPKPSPRPSDDCYTPNPTPSSDPNPSPDPSPSPEAERPVIATVVSRPEDVLAGTNPFQCGFAFPSGSGGTDTLSIAPSADDPSGLSVTVTDRFAPSLGEVSWIATDAVDEQRLLSTDHSVEIESSGPVPIEGNADDLHRVVGNLIDNSFRYTPPGSVSYTHLTLPTIYSV